MNKDALNDEMLKRYLLDDISDEERQIVEEHFLQDDSYFDEMLAFEDELYFDYQQDRLNPRERAVFEHKFLQSPEDHKKFVFANAFGQAAAQLAEEKTKAEIKNTEDSYSPSWWLSIATFFNFSTRAMQIGLAAASILLLLGAIGLFIQNAKKQDEIANLENSGTEDQQRQAQTTSEKEQQQAELQRQLENGKQQNPGDETKIQQIETEHLPVEQEVIKDRPRINQPTQKNIPQLSKSQTQQASAQRSVVALILSPGLFMRSGGEGMKRVVLSPSVKKLKLRLMIKNEDIYKSYRIKVKAVDEETGVWSSADLKPQQKGKNKTLSLSIPAKNLKSADYEISLIGITESGTAEEIANYYFSAVKSGTNKL